MYTTETPQGPMTEYDFSQLTTRLPSILTGSLVEQVVTAVFVTFSWIYVNAVDGLLIYVIKKNATLRENVHYDLLSVYMICDIITTNVMFFQILPATIGNDLLVFSRYYCRILSVTGSAIYFTSIHMLAFLALERLTFFKYPLKYDRYFTKTKIKISFLILLSLTMVYTAVPDAILERKPVNTMMSCLIPEGYRDIFNPMAITVFFVPSIGISAFTLILLGVLLKTHQARVHPMVDNVEIQQPKRNFLKKVKKHIKIIVLISGTFWITILPGMVIRSTMFRSGVTREETDNRSNMMMFILARLGWLMMTVFSSFINPLIYLALLSDLRKAVVKFLSRNSHIADAQTTH